MSAAVISALGHTLVAFMWQGAIVGVCADVLARRLADPQARHASDVAALLALPDLVLCTFALELSHASSLASAPVGIAPATTLAVLPATTPLGWPQAVTATWLLGVAFMAIRLARSVVAVRRVRLRARLADASLVSLANALAKRLGLRRPISVGLSDDVAVPGVIGSWRPLIVLPASAIVGAPPEYLVAVLTHELAHLRRLDPLVLLVQRTVEVVLFFHPATWSISRRLDETREHCCDDMVRGHLVDPLIYARALLFFEQARSAVPTLALSSSAGSLMTRIRRIVHTPPTPRLPVSRRLAPLLAMAGLTATILAAPACIAAMAESDEDSDESSQAEHAEHAATPKPQSVQSPTSEPSDADAEASASLGIEWLPASVESHAPAIVDAAQAHQVDPELLAIMVLVESRGNATVRSPRGARGLMQLMPATAQSLAEARGITDHSDSRLDDPHYNLDLGAQFLAEQLQRFGEGKSEDEAIRLAAGAYNAGPSRMNAYLQSGAPLSEESVQYMERVASLWSERNEPDSTNL